MGKNEEKILSFWEWFINNRQSYFFINEADVEIKNKMLNELEGQLHKYCDKLYFEIGGYPSGPKELIITAEGDIAYFDKVEKIISLAPKLDNWRFIAFKPPMGASFKTKFEDVEINASEVWFLPLGTNNANKSIDIHIGIRNYAQIKNSEWLNSAICKMLDTTIGEKSFALDINSIEIMELPNEPEQKGMFNLAKLEEYIISHKS